MSDATEKTLRGACFCGAISYKVTGDPLDSVYCHCTICQRLNSSPFVNTLHFNATAFSWTHSEPHEEALDSYGVSNKPWKSRKRCKKCGCTVVGHNAKSDKWSVWTSQLERGADGKIKDWERVKPTAHIFYGTRMLDINDDLGKWVGYEGKSERIS